MGLFSKNPPSTISDKQWARIQRGANQTEAREGGMFGSKAISRRKAYSEQLRKRRMS